MVKARAFVLVASIVALWAARTATAAELDVTLAVVAADAQAAPVAALVEVGLSQQGARLVERAEIDRILREQELNAAGLADREALVKVGRLLRADAFLLLSVEEPPKKEGEDQEPGLLRMRLTETVHGVRLLDWYAAWEPEKAEEAAARVAQEVSGPLSKLSLPAGELIPVGIVDIHRVLLGEEQQWVCRALKTMLSSRLSKEPRVVVLEREDLKLLQEEKGLTAGDHGAFWAAGALVEGTLQRRGTDKMELRLQVRAPDGAAHDLAPVAIDSTALGRAADQAAAAALKALTNAPPAGTWELAREGEQFLDQGMLLAAHRRLDAAIPVLETAFAMRPDDIECGAQLFYAVDGQQPGAEALYSDAEEAELVGRLIYLLRDATPPEDLLGKVPAGRLSRRLCLYMGSPRSRSSERVIALNRTPRKILVELQGKASDALAARAPDPTSLTVAQRTPVWNILISTVTAEDALRGIRDFMQRNVMPPELGGTIDLFRDRCDVAMGFAGDMSIELRSWPTGNVLTSDDATLKDLFGSFAELARSEDPLARFIGLLLYTSQVAGRSRNPFNPWVGATEAKPRTEEAVSLYLRELSTRDDISPGARFEMQRLLRLAIARDCTQEENVAYFERLWEPAIERGDVAELLRWEVGMGARSGKFPLPYDAAKAETVARWAALSERAAAVLETAPEQEDAARRATNLRATASIFRQRLRTYLDGLQRDSGAAGEGDFRPQIQRVLRYLPDLLPQAAPTRRFVARMLVREADWPRKWELERDPDGIFPHTPLVGDVQWIALATSGRSPCVGLVGVNLKTRTVQALWQTSMGARTPNSAVMRGVAVGASRSYVAVRDIGLVEFPGTESAGRGAIDDPRVLTQADGLPGAGIWSIASCGDRIWVGHGGSAGPEGGLGIYDPRTGEWDTVFNSAERGDTALEAGKPYMVTQMQVTPDGLLFCADPPERPGLWLLRTGSATPEYLGPPLLGLRGRIVQSPGGSLLNVDHLGLACIPPPGGKVEILLAGSSSRRYFKADTGQTWPLVESPFLQGSPDSKVALFPYQFGGLDVGYAAVQGDEMWARYGKDQIVILRRGKTIDEAEFIPNDILEGKPALFFVGTPYGLVAIGNGSVALIEEAP